MKRILPDTTSPQAVGNSSDVFASVSSKRARLLTTPLGEDFIKANVNQTMGLEMRRFGGGIETTLKEEDEVPERLERDTIVEKERFTTNKYRKNVVDFVRNNNCNSRVSFTISY